MSDIYAQLRLKPVSNLGSRLGSSLSAWRNFASLAVQNVPSGDSYQTANASSDLNLCWVHFSECMFSDVKVHIIFQFAMLDHYFSMPVSYLCCPQEKVSCVVKEMYHDSVEKVRMLSSFRRLSTYTHCFRLEIFSHIGNRYFFRETTLSKLFLSPL